MLRTPLPVTRELFAKTLHSLTHHSNNLPLGTSLPSAYGLAPHRQPRACSCFCAVLYNLQRTSWKSVGVVVLVPHGRWMRAAVLCSASCSACSRVVFIYKRGSACSGLCVVFGCFVTLCGAGTRRTRGFLSSATTVACCYCFTGSVKECRKSSNTCLGSRSVFGIR